MLNQSPQVMLLMGSINDGGANYAASYGIGSTTTVTTDEPHGLTTGQYITFSGVAGTGAALLNGISLAVTVTSTTVFTLAVSSTGYTLTAATGSFVLTSTGQAPLVGVVQAQLTSIRTGGFTGPIIFAGLWSCSNNWAINVVTETYIQTAITQAADPLGLTYYIPICNDPVLPWITGSYNNNPAPSGYSQPNSTNASFYINTTDNTHPLDLGTEYLVFKLANAIMNDVLPYIP